MADRVVIEIATIDEWPQRAQQRTPRVEITGDRPRLDQRIAFPFATMRLVVLLERGGRRRQCAGRTERAQHQVDANDKTDRKSVVYDKSVSVRVDLGGRRPINKKKKK